MDPKPWETDSTHLRNREPDVQSGPLGPLCMKADGSKGEEDKGKLPGVPHAQGMHLAPLPLL